MVKANSLGAGYRHSTPHGPMLSDGATIGRGEDHGVEYPPAIGPQQGICYVNNHDSTAALYDVRLRGLVME